ncbi:N-acetyl sugar amidotransferase [bacterium]|nr:N-acetyl sugar amidotransferase [bacterium]
MNDQNVKICARCIYDENTPQIEFDEKGVCNYCKMFDQLIEHYGTGKEKGEKEIGRIVQQIRREGHGKPYDCVIGVSGGTDSSFLLYWAVNNGLRPLAVHYDNTWNTSIATENIRKILAKLKIDLFTYVVDNKEMDDIYRAFFYADVSEIDAATDIALAEIMYRAADKHKVKYVLEGHSFMAEGITPIGRTYFDGKYIASVHKMFGKIPMKTFPNMPFWTFMKWVAFKRIKKIRPLWYIRYSKEEARKKLEKDFGWEYYGGHHLENRMTAFAHSYLLPKKFKLDYRNNSLSASVRNGIITREDAVQQYYHTEPYLEQDLLNYFMKRLNFDNAEFDKIMSMPAKNWTEYPTYKKRFERMRPFFFVLAKAHLVPMSFYMKYCFPVKQVKSR